MNVRLDFRSRAGRRALALILTGAALRILVFARGASLWEDESFLAVNLAQRGFRQMLKPLDFCQSAPPAFLLLEKASVSVFGLNEWAMRLPSLLAGLALLPLVWLLARFLIGEQPGLLALGLASLSPNLIRFSSEAKPYSIDALALMAAASIACLWDPPLSPKTWLTLAGLGIAAIAVSNAAPFALAALGAVWFVRALQRRPRGAHWFGLASLGLVWSLTFSASFIAFRRLDQQRGRCVLSFFDNVRPSAQPNLLSVANLAGHGFLVPILGLDDKIPAVLYWFALVLLAIGVAAVLRAKDWTQKAALFFPLALVLVAGLLGQWFFVLRLMMFTAAPMAMLLAAGAWGVAQWMTQERRRRAVFGCSFLLLLLFPLKGALYRARRPEIMAMRESVQFALEQARPGDAIYLCSQAVAGWVVYATNWRAPDRLFLRWLMTASRSTGVGDVVNVPSRGHAVDHEGWDLQAIDQGRLILVGVPEGIFHWSGANAPNPPDPGWAANEYARVLHSGAPRAIVVGVSTSETVLAELLNTFRGGGARDAAHFSGQGAPVTVFEMGSAH